MKYTHLLPFMEREELKKIAYEIINEELKGVKLEALYPFLDEKTLDEIVDLLIEKKRKSSLVRIIPFISKEKIEKIYEAADSGEIPDFDTTMCLPFLESNKVKEIFRKLIKKASTEADDDDEEESED